MATEIEISEEQLMDNPVVRRAKLRVYEDGSVRVRIWRREGAPHLGAAHLYLKADPASLLFVPLDQKEEWDAVKS